jgi:hypothetical protein
MQQVTLSGRGHGRINRGRGLTPDNRAGRRAMGKTAAKTTTSKRLLVDEFAAAISNPNKGLFTLANKDLRKNPKVAEAQEWIKKSHRFIIDDDLLRHVMQVCETIEPAQLLPLIKTMRLPFPNVWIEWDEHLKTQLEIEHYGSFQANDNEEGTRQGIALSEFSDHNSEWNGPIHFMNIRKHETGKIFATPISFEIMTEAIFVENLEEERLAVSEHLLPAALGENFINQYKEKYPSEIQQIRERLTIVSTPASSWCFKGESIHENEGELGSKLGAAALQIGMGSVKFLAVLFAMINQQRTITRQSNASGKKRYIIQGKSRAAMEYKTLTIDVNKGTTGLLDRTGGEGPSKRLHDVRGHWRTYRSGTRVWIRSHQRGDESLGIVQKEYSLTSRRVSN